MLRTRAGNIGLQWIVTVSDAKNRSRLAITTEELHTFVRDWPRSEEGRRLLEGLRCGLLWLLLLLPGHGWAACVGWDCCMWHGRHRGLLLCAWQMRHEWRSPLPFSPSAPRLPDCRAGSTEGWPRPPSSGEAEQRQRAEAEQRRQARPGRRTGKAAGVAGKQQGRRSRQAGQEE